MNLVNLLVKIGPFTIVKLTLFFTQNLYTIIICTLKQIKFIVMIIIRTYFVYFNTYGWWLYSRFDNKKSTKLSACKDSMMIN